MSTFNLATADKHALKAYAANELEISLPLTMNEETMREKIVARCKTLGIEAPTARIVDNKAGKKAKYHTIHIANQDKPGGSNPVFVGVQGVGYTIPRAINVEVPASVVEVLKNAIQDNVTQDSETGEMLHNEVPAYPFQDLGEVA